MSEIISPPPIKEPIVVQGEEQVSRFWSRYFENLSKKIKELEDRIEILEDP